jgi:hypothetical protein
MKLPNSQVTPETTTVHVTVNDGENPISGATVTIGEITGTTINGGCNLSEVPEGTETITVTKDGYNEYTDSITVSSTNNEFTITLTEAE